MKFKKGFSANFSWIFAIIVGAVILFLAFFIAMQIFGTGEYERTTETAKSLSNVLNPMITGFESFRGDSIELKKETRIYNSCSLIGKFGENRVQVSEKVDLGDKEWSDRGGNIPAPKYQYVFAEDVVETEDKELYFLSAPFRMPFKTGEIMIWYSKKYCFVDPPREIRTYVRNIGNINIEENLENCRANSIKVCFGRNDCDIVVEDGCNREGCEEYEEGRVKKENKAVFYTGNLVYGAIFGSVENYKCNVERLMKRLESLSEVYEVKSQIISNRCGSGLTQDITEMKKMAQNYDGLEDLLEIKIKSEEIEEKNRDAICELY